MNGTLDLKQLTVLADVEGFTGGSVDLTLSGHSCAVSPAGTQTKPRAMIVVCIYWLDYVLLSNPRPVASWRAPRRWSRVRLAGLRGGGPGPPGDHHRGGRRRGRDQRAAPGRGRPGGTGTFSLDGRARVRPIGRRRRPGRLVQLLAAGPGLLRRHPRRRVGPGGRARARSGPGCGITATYTWPDHVDGPSQARVGGHQVDVDTDLEVRADESVVRVTTSFVNPSGDHRLRVHLPLPQPADRVARRERLRRGQPRPDRRGTARRVRPPHRAGTPLRHRRSA